MSELAAIQSIVLPNVVDKGIDRVLEDAQYSNSLALVADYKKIVEPVSAYYAEAVSLIVEDRTQTDKVARANELLKQTNEIFKALETHRKSVKEDYKKATDVIDGTARVIKQDYLEPLITHLKAQSAFIFNLEESEKRARIAERHAKVIELGGLPDNYKPGIFALPDEQPFLELVETLARDKAEFEELERLRIENERQRIENERLERERLQAENARLYAAQAEERRIAEEARQKAVEAERQLQEERAKIAQAEAQKAADERAAIAKAEQEELRKQLAPDVEKVRDYLNAIKAVAVPTVNDLGIASVIANLQTAIILAESQITYKDIECPF